MPDLGIDVLFKGTNMLRLLQGLCILLYNFYKFMAPGLKTSLPAP